MKPTQYILAVNAVVAKFAPLVLSRDQALVVVAQVPLLHVQTIALMAVQSVTPASRGRNAISSDTRLSAREAAVLAD